jgi:hypothetical protein
MRNLALARGIRYALVILLLGAAIACVCVIFKEPTDAQLLERYTWQPLPASVQDIQVDKLSWGSRGRKLIFHFRLAKADVASLCASRSFQKFDWATYRSGNLFWGNTRAGGSKPQQDPYSGTDVAELPLYKGRRTPPPWFTPGDWDKSEVYVLKEPGDKAHWVHTQVLIYHNESAQTCFIEDAGNYGG